MGDIKDIVNIVIASGNYTDHCQYKYSDHFNNYNMNRPIYNYTEHPAQPISLIIIIILFSTHLIIASKSISSLFDLYLLIIYNIANTGTIVIIPTSL